MNLLLLEPDEVAGDGVAVLTGRRALHARAVLDVQAGDTVRVGVLGGMTGTAVVETRAGDAVTLRVTLDAPPPPRARVDVVLAIPRPRALKRVLPALAAFGVDRVVLVNAYRVEKSYFDSKVLAPDYAGALFREGLEQARDTILPELLVRPLLRPFVEDELDAWCGQGSRRLVLHPVAAVPLAPLARTERAVVAIGPEGGWIPFEIDLLGAQGFHAVSLGARALRTEVAVAAALGALCLRT